VDLLRTLRSCRSPSLNVGTSSAKNAMNAIERVWVTTDRLVICPSCSGFMRLARVANNLADSETFECRSCCLLVTAEQALEFSERTMF